jgi:CheY-like chemotaxis protein
MTLLCAIIDLAGSVFVVPYRRLYACGATIYLVIHPSRVTSLAFVGCLELLKSNRNRAMQVLNVMKKQQFSLLVVDDDDVDFMNVKRALKKNDLSLPIDRAANGLEALEFLNQKFRASGTVDKLVILLDLNMPKMNGIEFLQEMRNDPRFHTVPVIVLTTSDQQKDLEAAYNLNVAGYIVKPVEFQSFVETMKIVNGYWSLCAMPT